MRWNFLKLAHFMTIAQQLVEKLETFVIGTISWLFDSKRQCRFQISLPFVVQYLQIVLISDNFLSQQSDCHIFWPILTIIIFLAWWHNLLSTYILTLTEIIRGGAVSNNPTFQMLLTASEGAVRGGQSIVFLKYKIVADCPPGAVRGGQSITTTPLCLSLHG